jgi:hypothetical protein
MRVGLGVRARGAQVERSPARGIGRMEVAAPGLHHREGLEMMQREYHRPVASGREADDRPPFAAADRPEVAVHVPDHVAGDRRLPVPAGAPVEVLRVGIVVSSSLGRDDDCLTTARDQGPSEEVRPAIRGARGRQSMQEVHDRITPAAAVVVGRQVDGQLEPSFDSARVDRSAQLVGLHVALRGHGSGQCQQGREHKGCCESAHLSTVAIFSVA